MTGAPRVGIVGAGIIGVSSACILAERGFAVTVFDPADPGEGGASRGNAAHIIPAIVEPLASPDTLRDAFRLLTARDSPLIVPPGRALALAPWLAAFACASTPARWRRGVAALTAINRRAFPAWEALLGRAGLAALLRPLGAIEIYGTPASLAAGFERLRAVPPELTGGVSLLGGDELGAAEPALSPDHAGGVLIPATRVLTDPLEVARSLAGYARGLGVVFRRDRVDRLRLGEVVLAGGGTVAFDRLVVAAGVWSARLLRGLGETQPLEAERGYNLTIPLPRPVVNRALLFADRGVVATPLTGALRFGGWDELGGTEGPPDPRIFRRLEVLAAKLLPGFDWPGAVRWMGHRPSLPDSLPVIAASRRHPGVIYAFGHGHLGMTQGPATAEAVAALVAGEDPPFDLSPFCSRANRI